MNLRFQIHRGRLLRGLTLSLSLLCAQAMAEMPRTLQWLVGFPPGGGSDAVARVLAGPLGEELGLPVLVVNKPGAGGQIAAQALKASPADGSVMYLSHDHAISILPQLVKDAGYDPARDFVPVVGFASFVNVLALSGSTPARDVNDYLAWVRKQGGQSAIGIPAPASTLEFMVQLLARQQGLDLLAVPYRGGAPLINDMLGGQVSAGMASVPDFIELHRAGRLRMVAVMGKERQPLLPDVPTFRELGLAGLEDMPYYGLFAPTGTPRDVIERVSSALARILARPAIQKQLEQTGLQVEYMTAQQLGARERSYAQAWARIIARSGWRPQ